MKKYILIYIFIFLTYNTQAKEKITIYGLTLQKTKGASKIYTTKYNNEPRQIIIIKYLGHGYGRNRDKYKFQITKQIEGKEKEQFTYYMRDGDKINFKYGNFILIMLEERIWFKAVH